MSKFETVNTLMYKYLIEDLEENINLGRQRVRILENDNDFENAIFEEKRVIEWEEQLSHLQKYLSIEEKTHCNRPAYVEISHFDNFGNKINTEELNAFQLDEAEYYYKSTGIKLRDWRKLEEGKLYIFGNLTIEVIDGMLMSKYPQETMWYPLDEDYEGNKSLFEFYGDKEVYYKN